MPVQSALMLIAAFGSAAMAIVTMECEDRQRWIALLVPALGLIVLGVFFLPNWALALVGAAIGWIVAGLIVFRGRGPIEYQKAISTSAPQRVRRSRQSHGRHDQGRAGAE